jgi:hypothetical protein
MTRVLFICACVEEETRKHAESLGMVREGRERERKRERRKKRKERRKEIRRERAKERKREERSRRKQIFSF